MAMHIFSRVEINHILQPVIGKTLGQVDKNNVLALLNQNTYLNHPFHLANSKLSVFSIIFWHLE